MYEIKQLDFRSFRGVMLISFSILSFVFLFNACTKSDTVADTSFKPSDAKEWFYGSFKKAPEFSSFDVAHLGGKLPDWSKGIAYKLGGNEIVEYPLMKAKNTYMIPSDIAENEGKKIAAAALTKALFIRDAQGNLFLREVSIVPSYDYLVKCGFDISTNHFGSYSKEFAGSVIVSDWSGKFISGRKLENGKSIANITFKQQLNNGSKAIPQNRIGDPNCTIVIHTVWQKDCVDTYYGDVFAYTTCGEWYAIGTIEEEICGNGGGCDLSNPGPECGCELLGTCGSGGEDDPDYSQCYRDMNTEISQVHSVSVLNSASFDIELPVTRNKRYKWTCIDGAGGWDIESEETGVHKKTNGEWIWQSLTHSSIIQTGTNIVIDIDASERSPAEATIGRYFSGMALFIKIKYSMECFGKGIHKTVLYDTQHYFSIND